MAEHLKGLTGISITPDYLSYVLGRLGYSFKKPKHTLKNICDPKEYKRGKRVLRTLKKGP
jgi:transposase